MEQKTPAKKTAESVKNVNSEPVKVEPVEPKAKVIPAEKEKETLPEPKVLSECPGQFKKHGLKHCLKTWFKNIV